MIVLDASVIVKFSEEEYTEKALEIREKVRRKGRREGYEQFFTLYLTFRCRTWVSF